MKDLLGHPATEFEERLAAAYEDLAALLRAPDLAPTTEANLKEAAAALWIALNELGLAHARPDDLHL